MSDRGELPRVRPNVSLTNCNSLPIVVVVSLLPDERFRCVSVR
jgi:hypothetical protein